MDAPPSPTVKRRRARDPESVTALVRIGEEIERHWSARGYRNNYFHDIAAECLHAAAYHRQFDEDEIINWVNTATSLPDQLIRAATSGSLR